MDNSQLLIGTLITFGIVSLIAYLIAENIGRQKHIGGWWSFFLILTSMPLVLIPGLIAVISSPTAKNKPTTGNIIRTVVGLLLLAWALVLLISLDKTPSGFFWRVKVAYIFMLLPLGIYLYVLGQGLVVNKRPKYRENVLKSWIGRFMLNVKKSVSESNSAFGRKYDGLYYVVEENKPVGPLTLQQMKEKRLTEGTLVCRNGEKTWNKVEDMAELVPYVIYAPPPIGESTQQDPADRITMPPVFLNHDSNQSDNDSQKVQHVDSSTKQDDIDKETGYIFLAIVLGLLVLIFIVSYYE